MMNREYTGVGSRNTPSSVLLEMKSLAQTLARNKFFLRTGGADGADTAFEEGAKLEGNQYQLFLPSAGFNGRDGFSNITEASMKMAARYHPAWSRCPSFVRMLHARNAYQVLDVHLNKPSAFLVCWTQDGATTHAERSMDTGGTGTAISIASEYGVPVFNFQRESSRIELTQFLQAGFQVTINLPGQPSLF